MSLLKRLKSEGPKRILALGGGGGLGGALTLELRLSIRIDLNQANA